jgi:hypothetical protein
MSHESENRQQYYEEIKRRARQTNIADYLMNTGVKLRRVGNWYTLEEHDSYRIQGNKWYRNSQDKGGNAIDFLVEHYGISPKEAIEKLTAVDLSQLEISAKNRLFRVRIDAHSTEGKREQLPFAAHFNPFHICAGTGIAYRYGRKLVSSTTRAPDAHDFAFLEVVIPFLSIRL